MKSPYCSSQVLVPFSFFGPYSRPVPVFSCITWFRNTGASFSTTSHLSAVNETRHLASNAFAFKFQGRKNKTKCPRRLETKNVPGQVTAKRRRLLGTPPHSLHTTRTTRTTIIPNQTTLNVKLSRRIRSSNHVSPTSAPSTPYSPPGSKSSSSS